MAVITQLRIRILASYQTQENSENIPNKIGDDGKKTLIEMFQQNKTISKFIFCTNKIVHSNKQEFMDLSIVNGIVSCSIDIEPEEIYKVIESLKKHQLITSVTIFAQNQSDGVYSLVKIINECANISKIELSTYIGEEEFQTLCDALKTNNSITSVNLYSEYIGDGIATALATIIPTNTSLTAIYLGTNDISKEGDQALLESIKENKNITTLFVGDKKTYEHEAIKEKIQQNNDSLYNVSYIRKNFSYSSLEGDEFILLSPVSPISPQKSNKSPFQNLFHSASSDDSSYDPITYYGIGVDQPGSCAVSPLGEVEWYA